MIEKPRERELLSHFHHYFSPHNGLEAYGPGPPGAPEAISVVEFGPRSSDEVWIYVTLGASAKPMPNSGNGEESAYRDGATIPGPPGGLFPGSPLTDLLLAKPYFLDEDFDVVLHGDGSHTHILWVIPIYPSERLFAERYGDVALFDLFMEYEVDSSDLSRPPVTRDDSTS